MDVFTDASGLISDDIPCMGRHFASAETYAGHFRYPYTNLVLDLESWWSFIFFFISFRFRCCFLFGRKAFMETSNDLMSPMSPRTLGRYSSTIAV